MAKQAPTQSRTPRKRRVRTPRTSRGAGVSSALAGRAGRGKEMTIEIGPHADAAARSSEEKREPRPYTTRYPIPDERFRTLKESAQKAKVLKVPAKASADSG